jgi:hypothetical protein
MTDEIRLAFLGGATIYQGDRKFEATATLFAAEGPQPVESFFGHYDGVTPNSSYEAAPDGVESGAALIRFSDGSEADAMLAAVDPDRGGFLLTSSLRELHVLPPLLG